ncbi:MAG: sulfite exporter TauE/SafE family protein, partial [Chloroflexota bacterium]
MFFPGVGIEMDPLALMLLGLSLGVCTGFFGIGGGFMVTPALNLLGMPMAFAIGTDLCQMAGKAVVSTLKHRKLGNVDLRLGVIMVAGTVVGVEVGKETVMHLEGAGNVDAVVRYIYIAFLGGLGLFMLREARKSMVSHAEIRDARDVVQNPVVRWIRSVNVPPFISLPVSGIPRISIWVPLGVGFFTGVLAGLLGVGGGFIRMPALVYLMGVPTVVAVGTDLFEIIISGSYGALTYALADR